MENLREGTKCCWWCSLPIAGERHLPGCPGAVPAAGNGQTAPDAEPCPHNGLFATGAPHGASAAEVAHFGRWYQEWCEAEYEAWLGQTRHCYQCGADVPNRDL